MLQSQLYLQAVQMVLLILNSLYPPTYSGYYRLPISSNDSEQTS